jgi:hypothetical protein
LITKLSSEITVIMAPTLTIGVLEMILVAFLIPLGIEKGTPVLKILLRLSEQVSQRGQSPMVAVKFFLSNFVDDKEGLMNLFSDCLEKGIRERKAPCNFVPQSGLACGCSCMECFHQEDRILASCQKQHSQIVEVVQRVLSNASH